MKPYIVARPLGHIRIVRVSKDDMRIEVCRTDALEAESWVPLGRLYGTSLTQDGGFTDQYVRELLFKGMPEMATRLRRRSRRARKATAK